MGVTIKGLTSLRAKLKVLEPLTREAVERGVHKAGLLVEGAAKPLAPIDTGALRGSIHTTTRPTGDGATASVGTNVEYAAHQEFGTSRMKAQPYLQPALQKNKKKAKKIILDTVKASYKGL